MQAYTPYLYQILGERRSQYQAPGQVSAALVTDGKRATHVAMDADVVSGKTPQADGKALPLALSDKARRHGVIAVFRGTPQSYNDAALYAYLKSVIYGRPESLGLSTIAADFRSACGLVSSRFRSRGTSCGARK